MTKDSEYTLILFYRNSNKQSLQLKIALNDLCAKYGKEEELRVKEVNYDVDKTICQKYGIMGTPALLILENGELRGRFLGELNWGELETIIKNLLKINKQ